MEKLGTDKQKAQALNTGAMHACHILNNVVIPICKELNFTIDTSDRESLDCYMRDLSALHGDYVNKMKDGASNPAIAVVLNKTAEELWNKTKTAFPLMNPYVLTEIPSGIMDYLTLTGSDIYTFHARPNNRAIEEACIIYASKEDITKRGEIESVCDALNKCFNGMGGLFSGYITIVQGKFFPIEGVNNYQPLINGGY